MKFKLLMLQLLVVSVVYNISAMKTEEVENKNPIPAKAITPNSQESSMWSRMTGKKPSNITDENESKINITTARLVPDNESGKGITFVTAEPVVEVTATDVTKALDDVTQAFNVKIAKENTDTNLPLTKDQQAATKSFFKRFKDWLTHLRGKQTDEDLQKEYNDSINEKQTELDTLTAQLKSSESDLAQAQQNLQDLKTQTNSWSNKATSLFASKNSTNTTPTKNQKTNMENNITKLEAKVKSQTQALSDKENSLVQFKKLNPKDISKQKIVQLQRTLDQQQQNYKHIIAMKKSSNAALIPGSDKYIKYQNDITTAQDQITATINSINKEQNNLLILEKVPTHGQVIGKIKVGYVNIARDLAIRKLHEQTPDDIDIADTQSLSQHLDNLSDIAQNLDPNNAEDKAIIDSITAFQKTLDAYNNKSVIGLVKNAPAAIQGVGVTANLLTPFNLNDKYAATRKKTNS